MRTPEQGLLTTADAMHTAVVSVELVASAHAGDVMLAAKCARCRTLLAACDQWIADHAASAEELDELIAAGDGN